MWCSSCQQDVPGLLASDDAIGWRCARCQTVLGNSHESNTGQARVANANPTAGDFNCVDEDLSNGRTPPLPSDDWHLDEELREVRRMLRVLKVSPPQGAQRSATSLADSPTIALPSWHAELPIPRQATRNPTERKGKRRSSFVAWGALALGLTTFICGGILLGWSFVSERADLWRLGMPLAIAGQAGLAIGLILQLESLWQSTRDTSSTLSDLDSQLRELRHATTMLSTTHSTSAQSFYVHMAEGASPELLLADLKGQLDILAVQMAKERR